MDIEQYRKVYEAELSAAEPRAAAPGARFGLELRAPIGAAIGPILDAVQAHAHDPNDLAATVTPLLEALRTPTNPPPVRLAALNSLKAARFLGDKFDPYRADFLSALREVAQPDSDPELRESALATLTAEKDADTEQRLRAGLQDVKKALVSPLKALQILSLNDHADIADLATDVFHRTADLPTKEAALRVLSTNPKSQDLLQSVLEDKQQARSLRAMSATGLNFLNPAKFAAVAQDIIKDKGDFEDIRASALGALVNTPLHDVVRGNADFLNEVKTLSADGPLKNLSAAASRFLTK
jgi:hypothetical protein